MPDTAPVTNQDLATTLELLRRRLLDDIRELLDAYDVARAGHLAKLHPAPEASE